MKNKIVEILIGLKSILFKNKDAISLKELNDYNTEYIINNETEKEILKYKKLVQLNNIYYLWDYNSIFKKIIFSYKYKRKIKFSKFIARIIEDDFYYVLNREKIDVIISVPISKKRRNERGFNQVDEILNNLNVKYYKIKRVKNTEKMHKILDEKLREENVKGIFRIDNNLDLRNKNILIFDDIITTGATLREIKNSILNQYNKIEREKINFFVFCLAAALEIKKSKGEV